MSITIGKRQFRLTNAVLALGWIGSFYIPIPTVLLNQTTGFSAAPIIYGFLWLMWTLQGIVANTRAEKEKVERLEALVEQR